MKMNRSFALALAIAAFLGGSVWALAADLHADHHSMPASSGDAPSPMPMPGMLGGMAMPDADAMASQMAAMQAMHEKMMAARTPKERQALMVEHMQLMQGGMSMMSSMGKGGTAGMNCDMPERHRMMEQRMDMMQAMMQMMMDRMAQPPSK